MLKKQTNLFRPLWANFVKRSLPVKIAVGVVVFVVLFLFFSLHGQYAPPTTFASSSLLKSSAKDWALHVTEHQKSIHSQGGQDGSLDYIFQHIGTTNKYYVEFGFSNDRMEGGTGANTYNFYLQGWTGLLLDGEFENKAINLHKLWIKPETIVSELRSRGVPENADYISVDIDSADCFVFKEIACEMKPRVMTVEYNSNLPLASTLANMGGDFMWSKMDRLYGCALGAHAIIAKECGYEIVDVVPKLDVVLVRKDLLKGSQVPPLKFWEPFTNLPINLALTRFHDAPKYMCVYEIYQATKDFAQCSGKAVQEQIDRLDISFSRMWYRPFG